MIHRFNFYEKVSMVRMNSGERTMLEWRIREKKISKPLWYHDKKDWTKQYYWFSITLRTWTLLTIKV